MNEPERPYGFELIMDLHDCNVSTFSKESLEEYLVKLCKAIDMQRCKLYFWDDMDILVEERPTSPHTKGVSAVQFIVTSSIVIHALHLLEAVYVNIFSCKSFDREIAEQLTREWFGAKQCKVHFVERT